MNFINYIVYTTGACVFWRLRKTTFFPFSVATKQCSMLTSQIRRARAAFLCDKHTKNAPIARAYHFLPDCAVRRVQFFLFGSICTAAAVCTSLMSGARERHIYYFFRRTTDETKTTIQRRIYIKRHRIGATRKKGREMMKIEPKHTFMIL